jgi:hypothetical protein
VKLPKGWERVSAGDYRNYGAGEQVSWLWSPYKDQRGWFVSRPGSTGDGPYKTATLAFAALDAVKKGEGE